MLDFEATTPGFIQRSVTLSERALSDLSGLIAGLDQLELLRSLPAYPELAAPRVAFGEYLLEARLGAGSFGSVFLAQDNRLGRRVVVKVPHPEVLADSSARKRFLREPHAAAILDHPGIVPVFDVGEICGLPFLVAGFVDGPTLEQWFSSQRGPLKPKEAARLIASLARSVHHAHERGVLHCDLKPGNILLQSPGPNSVPVITDFGMARILTDDPSQTRTFQQAGTPLYMSPEQARGDRRALTARSDVYSLGVILFELLTGRTPFVGESGAEVLVRIQEDPTPCAGAVNADITVDLRAICRQCMEKDPHDRYASASALAVDLDRYLQGLPVEARRLGPIARAARWGKRNPLRVAVAVLIAGLLAAMGVLLAAWWAAGIRHDANIKVADAQLQAAIAETNERTVAGRFIETLERVRRRRVERHPDWPALNLADLKGLPIPASISDPAALRVEAAAALGGVDLGIPRAVANGFKAYSPAFSPDGSILALSSWFPDDAGQCTVLLLDPASGTERRRLHFPADSEWERRYAQSQQKRPGKYDGCRSLAFSRDGRWLVVGTRSGWLVRWDLKEREPAPVTWRHAPPPEIITSERVSQLAFLPTGHGLVSSDGTRLSIWNIGKQWKLSYRVKGKQIEIVRNATAFDRVQVSDGESLLRPALGEAWHRSTPIPFLGGSPAAAPGGKLLITNRNDPSMLQPYALHPPGEIAPGEYGAPFIAPGDRRTEDGAVDDLMVSPDGLYLATSSEHMNHLKLWSVASGILLSARTLQEGSLRLSFSPDGRTLAVCEHNRTLLYTITPPLASATIAVQPYAIVDAALAGRGAGLLCTFKTDSGSAQSIIQQVSFRGAAAARVVVRDMELRGLSSEQRIALSPNVLSFAYKKEDAIFWANPTATAGPGHRPVSFLNDLQFGPDRRLWIAAESLVCWGADGSERQVSFPTDQGRAVSRSTCLAVGRSAVMVGRSDGTVCQVDPTSGRVVQAVQVSDSQVTAICLSQEGRHAIAGTASGMVGVCSLETGRVVLDLTTAHEDTVTAIAAGPGNWFATGSRDRQVKIWTPTGMEFLSMKQSRPIRRLFWSADGKTLTILAEGERGLQQWDLGRLKESFKELGLEAILP